MKNMELRWIIGPFKTRPVEELQKRAGILPYEPQLKDMASTRAARLYFDVNKAIPVKQHLKTLILTSRIDELTMMCNDIDCATRKIHELHGTVKPDPKADTKLQRESATVIL